MKSVGQQRNSDIISECVAPLGHLKESKAMTWHYRLNASLRQQVAVGVNYDITYQSGKNRCSSLNGKI